MLFALIGCGGIGELRAAALAKTPGLKLAAASDLDPARAESIARRFGGAAVADWRALLGRDDVDAVIVSTPPSLHTEMTLAALHSGKHVLCEKPLGRNPDECRAMVDAARTSGRFLATGFNYRFYPSILKARELFDSGIIGELDHIRSYSGYSATEHTHPWLHDFGVMGGGALRDNGIHLIDLTRYFLGEAVEVRGWGSEGVWGFRGCEDNGFALLRSREGKIATLQASWTEWRGYRFALDITGTRGSIRASCFPMITDLVYAGQTGGPTRRRRFLFPRVHLMEKLKTYRWVVVESFVEEFRAFERAVRGEKSAVATGEDGLRAVEIAHLACPR